MMLKRVSCVRAFVYMSMITATLVKWKEHLVAKKGEKEKVTKRMNKKCMDAKCERANE